jgi:hypothetical protein
VKNSKVGEMLELFNYTDLHPTISLHTQVQCLPLQVEQVEQLHRCSSQYVAPAKRELNEEKSKHIGLAQQNGFLWAQQHFPTR